MNLSIMLFPFQNEVKEGTGAPDAIMKSFQDFGIRALEPMNICLQAAPQTWDRFHRAARDAGV